MPRGCQSRTMTNKVRRSHFLFAKWRQRQYPRCRCGFRKEPRSKGQRIGCSEAHQAVSFALPKAYLLKSADIATTAIFAVLASSLVIEAVGAVQGLDMVLETAQNPSVFGHLATSFLFSGKKKKPPCAL